MSLNRKRGRRILMCMFGCQPNGRGLIPLARTEQNGPLAQLDGAPAYEAEG